MRFSCITALVIFISASIALAQDESTDKVADPAKAAPAAETEADSADDAPATTEGAESDADSAETESADGSAPADSPSDDSPLKTEQQKTSYAIGVSIGRGLKRDIADVDAALVSQGLVDALTGADALLTDQQVREVIIAFQKQRRAQSAMKKPGADDAGKQMTAAAAFLEENKKKEDVVVLPSGLQYQILKEGDGDKPKATDTVRVHYRGTLIDGTEFDSSLGGEPIEFPLTSVVKGWTEGLQLMTVGSKWKLFLPPQLGYGDKPRGNKIKAGDALIFEIELLEIK